MKSASIYIPMGNEKNEDCNDREANLCIDAQAAKEGTYIRLVIFTSKEKSPQQYCGERFTPPDRYWKYLVEWQMCQAIRFAKR